MLDIYITAFVTLFVIIDPIGLLPLFVALTQGMDAKARRGIAFRAVLIAMFLLFAFGLVGETMLEFIGIGLPAFRIAGGLLLFLTAVEMLFEKRSQRREKQAENDVRPDPSVFPLATPLIAGPGAMATMVLLSGSGDASWETTAAVSIAMITIMLITIILFSFGGALERMLGQTGVNVITRLFGMLLAALAVQFVVDGLRGLGVLG